MEPKKLAQLDLLVIEAQITEANLARQIQELSRIRMNISRLLDRTTLTFADRSRLKSLVALARGDYPED